MAHVKLVPSGERIPVGNIFVIGRNYIADPAARAAQAERPLVVSMKPTSALLLEPEAIRLPAHSDDVHFEIELLILIGEAGRDIPEDAALAHVLGYGVGLDLTAHDLHRQAQAEGLPWTSCKGFETAAPVSAFVEATRVGDPERAGFELQVNGETRQRGSAADMVFGIARTVSGLSRLCTLQRGDIIYTGTPAGAATLHAGDRLHLDYAGLVQTEFSVA